MINVRSFFSVLDMKSWAVQSESSLRVESVLRPSGVSVSVFCMERYR